jgi:hypothetical protein
LARDDDRPARDRSARLLTLPGEGHRPRSAAAVGSADTDRHVMTIDHRHDLPPPVDRGAVHTAPRHACIPRLDLGAPRRSIRARHPGPLTPNRRRNRLLVVTPPSAPIDPFRSPPPRHPTCP